MESLRVHLMLSLQLVVAISQSNADFAEYPSNITLPFGSEIQAVFKCRHPTANFIDWRVNGTSVGQSPPTDITPGTIRDDDGNLVNTLTIIARPEYNGTEVECVAVFSGGSPDEATPSVTLTIIDATTTESPTISTHTTAARTAVTSAPVTTPAAVTSTEATTVRTTEEPTTLAEVTTAQPNLTTVPQISDFDEVPSPLVMIMTMMETHTYKCNHSRTNMITWRVNGSQLNVEIFPPNIDPKIIQLSDGGRVYTLTIGGLSQHNETTIQCVARFSGLVSPLVSPMTTFLMQGSLQGASNLTRSTNTLSWVAPFSLDLTNVDPDIVYCVEVYNITCGRSLLISECDVMETSYTNDALHSGYIYEYTVTPRSNVEGARNGTSLTVTDRFLILEESSMGHSVSMMNITEMEYALGNTSCHMNVSTQVTLHLDMLLYHGATRPATYSISLDSLDDFNIYTHDEFLDVTAFSYEDTAIVLKVAPLPFRRLWNVTVFAYDCDNHPLMEEMELGTHDFHDISVNSSPSSGMVLVTGDVINGLTSMGILVIVYSRLNHSDVSYNFIPHHQDRMAIDFTVMGLPYDHYEVSVFVVEESGLPFCRAAAMPRTVQDNKANEVPEFPIEYELNFTSTGVCISCTFLNSSTTDCVAVVHQRISQLSSSGLMNIDSSYKLNRSDDTAYGCIEGVNLEQYQIGVVGGIRKVTRIETFEPQSAQCAATCQGIIGAAVVAFILVVLVVIAIVIFVSITKRNQKNGRSLQPTATNAAVDVSQSENQYETVQLCVRVQSDGGGGTRMEAGVTVTSVAQERDESTPRVDGTSATTAPPTISDEGLTEQQEPQDQERPKSPSEKDTPDIPHHESPQDDGDSLDPVQQRMRSSEEQQKHADENDHQSDFDKQATESKQATSEDGGRFESGKDSTIAPETASITDDNRSGDGMNKSEESQSTSCTPIPFNTRYEGPTVDQGMSCAEDQCDIGSLKYQNTDNIQVSKGNITRHHCHKFKATQTLLITDTSGHTPIPFTLESLLRKLLPLASKWLSLGKALSLDEDRLDEIFTNNETDEARLQEMLEVYMVGSDFNHSWEEVQEALKNIGEESVINQPKVTPDKILTEYQDPQDEESPKPQHENEDTPYSPHYEPPPDDGYSLSDPVQQSMNEDQEEPVNRDDYESNYEEQAKQSNESTKKEGTSQFENGRRATANSGPMTNDNDSRKIYVMKETEEYQRTTCIPIVFNTVYEGSTVDHNQESGQVKAPSSEVLLEIVSSQTTRVSSADELVICHNWLLLKKHNTVMPRTVHLKET